MRGLYRPVAASEEEALNLLFEGETNRAIAEHKLNKASSRSGARIRVHLPSLSALRWQTGWTGVMTNEKSCTMRNAPSALSMCHGI